MKLTSTSTTSQRHPLQQASPLRRLRLQARSSYPRPVRLMLHTGPLQRLAWIFGFGR
jgi:hypothetical protein